MKRFFNYKTGFYLSAIFALLFVFSCSTKKNTWTRRAYHNVTCHYNVFWNGVQSQIEGVDNLKNKVEEDYSEVLRVYNYGTKQDAKELNPKMDRAIKKASIAIQRHSMYFSGKELNKYVMRSYLLMGKAYFYKQEYISARRVFDYIAKNYSYDPIHYKGLLWLAKTYIQTEQYQKAEAVLNMLATKQNEKDFPTDVYNELPLVNADLYLAQKRYDVAYSYLERGLEINKDKEIKTRLNFILGQINQKEGDFERAKQYYRKVIKSSPPFKMDFEARLNLAKCYTGNGDGSKEILKVLNKMLKDTKNQNYLDQIYYALADVALKNKNDSLAVDYLKLSVSTSSNNKKQKALSALKLGEMFFDNGDYVNSQAYYDTAVSFMPESFPDKELIKNRASTLSIMVNYLQTIHDQDSLQKLAKMDSADMLAIIDNRIAEYRAEKQRKQKEEQEMREAGGTQFVSPGGRNPGVVLGGSRDWYFYNATTKARGYSEFLRKWGQRKLEDNWFLSDKRQMLSSFEEGETADTTVKDTTSVPGADDPENRAYYLKNLPKTDADFKISDSLMIEAYNKLGFLYREELHDTVGAFKTYLEFEKRFPENRYQLETWFSLYQLYKAKHKSDSSQYYKNLILGKYPQSDYAKLINDPDYFVKKATNKNKAVQLYEKTYKAFKREQYLRVITYAEKGIEQAGNDTALLPRFMYLKAIALGKVDVPDTLYTLLKTLVQQYPQSAVTPMAKDIIQVLAEEYGIGDTAAINKLSEKEKEEKSPYVFQPDSPHFVMFVVLSDKVKVRPLKVRISDFNRKYFRLKSLKVKSLMLDNQRVIITIGNFSNKNDADNYFQAIKNDEYVFSGVSSEGVFPFTISLKNYPVFYREKDQKGYQKFWDKYYKK